MKHKNNFDFLRLVAAFAVLVSHLRPLHDNTFPLGALGAFGVFMFFSMSGYLVSASWERDQNSIRFLSRRVLRIFPGLIVAILVTAFIIGPIATKLPFVDYIRSPGVIQYCKSVILFPMSFSLPGVFTDNPFKENVNGSLWTLPMEVFLYGALTLVNIVLSRRPKTIVPVLTTLLALAYGCELRNVAGSFLTMQTQELYRCAIGFLVGSLLWQVRDRWKVPTWLWMPICAFLITTHDTQAEVWSLILLVPFATISFATTSYGFVRHAGRFGDISYGLYIYAFLIQQTLMHFFPSISLLRFFFASAGLSMLAGFISWHVIEKHALKLKPTSQSLNFSGGRQQPMIE
jgi:peptidoglycan/LPS O-acetylase OafA/YrhL